MKDVKVCENWHGKAKEEFRFVNFDDKQTARITKYEDYEWPFKQSEPIEVGPKGPGGPGSTTCDLKDLPNKTYYYWVDICSKEGAPQNVTIP